jgi:hypothetical protein
MNKTISLMAVVTGLSTYPYSNCYLFNKNVRFIWQNTKRR